MAETDVRISELTDTTTSAANDDYIALDGATYGTRKMLASNLVGPEASAREAGDEALDEKIGTLSNLTTTAKGSAVAAINEVDSHADTAQNTADTNAAAIGTLSSLTTDAKGSLVAAINEVDGHADGKVDKVNGKGLSTNDYTDAEKTKLSGIEAGAEVNDVTSVAGKTGAVTLAGGDVSYSDETTYADGTVGAAVSGLKSDLNDIFTDDMKEALLACFDGVAWAVGDGQAQRDALENALYGLTGNMKTVLYTDGHFIINEKETDRQRNISRHGAVVVEYDPLDQDHPYVFDASVSTGSTAPWASRAADVTGVEIGSKIKPTLTRGWFQNFTNCESVSLNNMNCSALVSTRLMFGGCSSLEYVDLSVMADCSPQDIFGMFYNCASLRSADLSMLDGSKITTIAYLFRGCSAITSAKLPDFTTNRLTSVQSLFYDCGALASVDLSKLVVTSLVNNTAEMFQNCTSIQTIDISTFTDVSGVVSMFNMFRGCTALTTIYAPAVFNTDAVTNSNYMFYGSTRLVGGNGTTYNSSHTDKTYARIDASGTPGYFTAKA